MRLLGRSETSRLESLAREAALARVEIRQGRFQRSMAVITAVSAIVSGFEAFTQHQRGAFKDRWMWTPVALTPPTVVAGMAALFSERSARRVVPALSVVSLLDGALGFALHLRGIRRLPGGFGLGRYNVIMGPPVFAPLLTGLIGVAGLLTAALRRESWTPLEQATRRAPRRDQHGLDALQARVAHGRFQRVLAITAASFAVLAGGEAYLEHLRGSFNRRVMWTPIWVTPPMVVAAAGAVASEQVARRVLPWASVVTFLDGVLGFMLHLQGIRRMPGGFRNLQFNLTLGPPLFAPLLFSSVGLLGFIAALLRRKEAR
jgi:hypothetical protein